MILFYYWYNINNIVLNYVLDSDIQNKYINQSDESLNFSLHDIMLNKYNMLESKYKSKFDYFKITSIMIHIFTYGN